MSDRTLNSAAKRIPAAANSPSDGHRITDPQYVLGHSPAEIRRLMMQAKILRPITERLLRCAGVETGMRVLDLGCGAGDVSFLAAELVGSSGSVVGIDRSAKVIAEAQARARAVGLGNVSFNDAELAAFSDSALFDCVIGRYVLIHQPDPKEFLRAAARFVRPGGMHEVDLTTGLRSQPIVRLWDAIGELIQAAFRETLPHFDAASRLIEHFSNAGLPAPSLFCEVPVGGGESSPVYDWLAETLRSVQPQLVKMGIVTDDGIPIEALENNLRTAAVEARSQIQGPAQICAWTR